MNSAHARVTHGSAQTAFLWAGLTCGAMDITAAFVVYGPMGLKPVRLLQGIAAGLLGRQALNGGLATALLGLVCHFVIAFSAAGVYVVLSRKLPFLLQHTVVSGILYGLAVYFFMNRVVVPLSGAIKRPFSLKLMTIGVIIHIICVGLPISLIVKRYSHDRLQSEG